MNVIDPKYLADQHLIREYQELKMVPKALLRTLGSKKGYLVEKVPSDYVLGTGHGYFFYDKLAFIKERFGDILIEMRSRGFATNFVELPLDGISDEFLKNYKPTDGAIQKNLERIFEKISARPFWYRYRGIKQNYDWWMEFYKEAFELLSD